MENAQERVQELAALLAPVGVLAARVPPEMLAARPELARAAVLAILTPDGRNGAEFMGALQELAGLVEKQPELLTPELLSQISNREGAVILVVGDPPGRLCSLLLEVQAARGGDCGP